MYCECSAGCYMRLFSEVFEKCVTITIVDTIVNGGASECVFEILGLRSLIHWIVFAQIWLRKQSKAFSFGKNHLPLLFFTILRWSTAIHFFK